MASVPYTPTSDPTDGERAQLYRYHLANKFLNQQELAQWFERSFDRSINQSTVSRILRKFNEDPDLLVVAETIHKSMKRKREVLHPELESALLEWFLQHELLVESFFEKKEGNCMLYYIQTMKFLN
ncbi:hypothetical protein BGX38DRAFT_1178897 [Terfezia claveryi]|nr:hypothetical protein BGX38DRAFT_1178897 [Terfezia claveryi]